MPVEIFTKIPLSKAQHWLARGRRHIRLDEMEETQGFVSFPTTALNKMLAAYDQLHLQSSWKLEAFVWRSTTMGGGLILARGRDHEAVHMDLLPDPTVPATEPPYLSRQAHHAMVAISGTGNPESYLQASLLSREFQELGSFYETVRWKDHQIVDHPPALSAPSDFDPIETRQITRFPFPKDLSPRIRRYRQGTEVIFFTTLVNDPGSLFRFNDRYVKSKGYCYLSTQTSVVTVTKSPRALTAEQEPVRPPKNETKVWYG